MRSGTQGMTTLYAAAAVGLVHAAFSLYWALGGRWLLDTVGQWALTLATQSSVAAGLGLGLIALLKVAGAVVPVLVEQGRIPGRRVWRVLEWAGAIGLTAYGLLNVVVAWAVLLGVIATPGGYDHAAMLGHAALWDPLFLAWGVLLAVALWRSRHNANPLHR